MLKIVMKRGNGDGSPVIGIPSRGDRQAKIDEARQETTRVKLFLMLMLKKSSS
jgi:hypothetical protein